MRARSKDWHSSSVTESCFKQREGLSRALLEAHPGDLLRLEVVRDGQRLDLVIPLEPMGMQF
jgi:hypothetical protein